MPSTPAHGPIALVVDDDPAMQHLIDEVLTDAGLLVYTAGDGRAALNVIEECRPDVIVLDFEMPVMSGGELCRRLRQSARSTPVMILSSLGSDRVRRQLGA